MASYLVLTPPGGADQHHDSTRFVRDGFAGIAFVLPAFWLFGHRLWLAGLAALLLQGIGMQLMADGAVFAVGAAMLLAVSLLTAFEGRILYVNTLLSKNWRIEGIIEAEAIDVAEDIYFAERKDERPVPFDHRAADWTATPAGAIPATGRNGPALGLFDIDGGR